MVTAVNGHSHGRHRPGPENATSKGPIWNNIKRIVKDFSLHVDNDDLTARANAGFGDIRLRVFVRYDRQSINLPPAMHLQPHG